MKFEIKKLHGAIRHYSNCLFCNDIPRFSVRPKQLNERVERFMTSLVCEKHLSKIFRMFRPLFELDKEIELKKQETTELINRRIIAKSNKIHPIDKPTFPWERKGVR